MDREAPSRSLPILFRALPGRLGRRHRAQRRRGGRRYGSVADM